MFLGTIRMLRLPWWCTRICQYLEETLEVFCNLMEGSLLITPKPITSTAVVAWQSKRASSLLSASNGGLHEKLFGKRSNWRHNRSWSNKLVAAMLINLSKGHRARCGRSAQSVSSTCVRRHVWQLYCAPPARCIRRLDWHAVLVRAATRCAATIGWKRYHWQLADRLHQNRCERWKWSLSPENETDELIIGAATIQALQYSSSALGCI